MGKSLGKLSGAAAAPPARVGVLPCPGWLFFLPGVTILTSLAFPKAPECKPDLCDSASLREKISQTAQAILDVRGKYPDSSLADLYDPLTMPSDLRAAHAANDHAVLAAYGLKPDTPEPEIVAHLFKLYFGFSQQGETP